MSKKKLWWGVGIGVVLALGLWLIFGAGGQDEEALKVKAEYGDFEVIVTVTGELQAKNSENIEGPNLRGGVFRFGDYKIQDMVTEGTIVDSGDYVASLDRSTAGNSLLDVEDAIETAKNKCLTTKLDTTMTLQGLRDELLNKTFTVEEAEIKLEQSKFEPPATIRQAEIDLDKAKRALEQAHANYELKVQQSRASMQEAEADLEKQLRKRKEMMEILAQFTIRAPKKGMVIYYRDWSGQKRKVGSSISPWDPIVATLPDLSVMISKTYVNEIDISKVKRGQEVRLGIDAFPEKSYTGKVIEVADIGEQLANADAKVFEVVIQLNETDGIMRPSMTTSNAIVINTMKEVTYLPIEAVFSQDSIPFVYTEDKERRVVLLGESNENQVIIEDGVKQGEVFYISEPEDGSTWPMVNQELIPTIKERAEAKKKALQEAAKKSAQPAMGQRPPMRQ